MGTFHVPRVAWEGACIFVEAATTETYEWLSEMLWEHVGVIYALKLAETRLRLEQEEASLQEAAAWRARLDELLVHHPSLAPLLHQLVTETADRLRD